MFESSELRENIGEHLRILGNDLKHILLHIKEYSKILMSILNYFRILEISTISGNEWNVCINEKIRGNIGECVGIFRTVKNIEQ